jgi:hypothetical protein
MFEGTVIVNVTVLVKPEDGTLPEPAQPVQTYWVPAPPETGDVTDSVMLLPESNQPLTGVGES